MLQDIATLTGGKAITEDLGIKLENVKMEDLGQAKKITIDNSDHESGARGTLAFVRKRLITPTAERGRPHSEGWLDLEHAAAVEVSSEEADYPIESALLSRETQGWRASRPGAQTVRPSADRGFPGDFDPAEVVQACGTHAFSRHLLAPTHIDWSRRQTLDRAFWVSD